MNTYKVVNLNGVEMGQLEKGTGRVVDGYGRVVFRLAGDKLTAVKDGEVFTVLGDGRVADANRQQVMFIYDYADYLRGGAGQTINMKVVPEPSGASSANRAAGTGAKTASSGWLIKLLLAAVAIFILIKIFAPSHSGIEGTWVPSVVEINGKKYAYAEYQKQYNDYHSLEFNFSKDGTAIITADSKSSTGKWYHSSGDTYMVTNAGASSVVTLKDGKLYLAGTGGSSLTIIFSRK